MKTGEISSAETGLHKLYGFNGDSSSRSILQTLPNIFFLLLEILDDLMKSVFITVRTIVI
jgi:hypothetical protein